MPIAYYNGRFCDESEIRIAPTDRGLLLGDGVFDSMRAVQNRIVSFAAHDRRLREACRVARIPLVITTGDLREILGKLLTRNQLAEAYLRITISRGDSDPGGFGFSKEIKPNTLIQIRPTKTIPTTLYEKGVAIGFESFIPHIPAIKSLSMIHHVLAKQNALDQNCFENIFCDTFDRIYEGSSSNVFIVKNGVIYTPPLKGVLPGVTRERVIHILKEKLKIPIEEVFFSKKDLLEAEECFLTNSSIEIMPVTKIMNSSLSDGLPGSLTGLIHQTFRQTKIEILE